MKEKDVKQVYLLSDLAVLLTVVLPGVVCLLLGDNWSLAGAILLLCGLLMAPFYRHGYKLEGRKGVFRMKEAQMPRECRETILTFLDGHTDTLDLHPVVQGGALVDIYYRKGETEAFARYFDYADFAKGVEYPLRSVNPDQVKKLESYITKTKLF